MKEGTFAALRTVALMTLLLGGIAAIGLLRRAQQHPPAVVVAGFLVWVAAPFVVLGIANLLSARWPSSVRGTVFAVTLFVVVASLAVYVDDSFAHRTAKPAFVYVAVPPASVLLSAIVIGIAAFTARKGTVRPTGT